MAITFEAVYENGVLKPIHPLPLQEHEKVQVTVTQPTGHARRAEGLIGWTGSVEDLDYLIEDVENDPLESP